jgi:phosphate-selective porin OprO/OprP
MYALSLWLAVAPTAVPEAPTAVPVSASPAATARPPTTPTSTAPSTTAPVTAPTTTATSTPTASTPTAPAPAPAPSPASTAGPVPAPSPLLPRTDAARLAEAPVDGGKARWRPGVGLEVSSADKRFSIQFNLLAQLLATVRHTPAIPMSATAAGSDAVTDFSLQFRRARLVLGGNLFTPNIKYKVQLTASPTELGWHNGAITRSPILDWYFTFDRLRDATFRVGQYKVPYNHQRMLRVTGMQFVERSAANNEFTMDRDIGLDVHSKDVGGLGKLRYYAGVYLGDGIALYGPSDFGLAYVGRVEVLPFGQYDDLEEADHERLKKPRMLIGGAFAFIDKDPHDQHGFGGQIPADGRKASTLNATADVNFRFAGFAFEGGFFWRKATRMTPVTTLDAMGIPVAPVAPRSGLAYFTQAGYLLPRLPLELGLRWGQIFARGDAAQTSLRDQSELGGVFNYYFARHFLKLQLDYLHLWNTQVRQGTDQIRLQLQAMF